MKLLFDFQGRTVRLTGERRAHITDKPKMGERLWPKEEGLVFGFSILHVSHLAGEKPLVAELLPVTN